MGSDGGNGEVFNRLNWCSGITCLQNKKRKKIEGRANHTFCLGVFSHAVIGKWSWKRSWLPNFGVSAGRTCSQATWRKTYAAWVAKSHSRWCVPAFVGLQIGPRLLCEFQFFFKCDFWLHTGAPAWLDSSFHMCSLGAVHTPPLRGRPPCPLSVAKQVWFVAKAP